MGNMLKPNNRTTQYLISKLTFTIKANAGYLRLRVQLGWVWSGLDIFRTLRGSPSAAIFFQTQTLPGQKASNIRSWGFMWINRVLGWLGPNRGWFLYV